MSAARLALCLCCAGAGAFTDQRPVIAFTTTRGTRGLIARSNPTATVTFRDDEDAASGSGSQMVPNDAMPLGAVMPEITNIAAIPIVEAPPGYTLPPLSAPTEEPPVSAAQPIPSFAELGAFALPTLALWLSSPLLSLIDTSVVGTVCGTASLAALGPSTKACDYLAYFCTALGAATTNLAAAALAAKRLSSAKRLVATSLTTALLAGVTLSGVLFAGAPTLMAAMLGPSGSPEVLRLATEYTSIRALGYPAALLAMVLQSAFLASKDARSPLLAVPFAGLANLLGDVFLVRHLGMGCAGAAWATVGALYVNAAVLLRTWLRRQPRYGERIGARPRDRIDAPERSPLMGEAPSPLGEVQPIFAKPRGRELKALAAFTAPMLLAISARTAMGLGVTTAVATLGTVALATHQIVECLYWLMSPFGDAVSLCAQAYLPPLLADASRPAGARGLQRRTLSLAACLAAAIGAASVALTTAMPTLFTHAPPVISLLGLTAPMLAVSCGGYVITGALEGALIARRQLRSLACLHLLNAAALLYVVRYLIARASSGLRAMWAVMAALNVMRVLEMSVLLARAECQRAERTATPTERDLRSLSDTK